MYSKAKSSSLKELMKKKMLLKTVCLLLCVSALEAVVPFDRAEYNFIKGYLNDVYTYYKQNTTNKKWFTTHLDAHGYVAYDDQRNNIVIAYAGSYSVTNIMQNLNINLVDSGDCDGCQVKKSKKKKRLERFDRLGFPYFSQCRATDYIYQLYRGRSKVLKFFKLTESFPDKNFPPIKYFYFNLSY